MVDGDAAPADDSADQKMPMADAGIFLAAHDGDALPAKALFEPLDAVQKQRCFGEAIVKDVPIGVVEFGVIWPAAQLLAHVEIREAGLLQGGL